MKIIVNESLTAEKCYFCAQTVDNHKLDQTDRSATEDATPCVVN